MPIFSTRTFGALGCPTRPSRPLLATRLAILVGAAAIGLGCFAHQYRRNPRIAVAYGDPIVQMKPHGELPSVESATVVPADRHSDPPDEFDRIIGVDFGSLARAYPLGLLDKFEVVNDRASNLPYVVARCALTGLAAIYDRRAGGRTLTFENSGALWRDTLVLKDQETGTYWTAATGEALAGPLAGERLSGIPAVVTRAENWRRGHPDTLYLDLDRSTAVSLAMRLYEASAAQGVSGRKTSDKRYKPKQEVFVFAAGRAAIAIRADEVREAARIEMEVEGRSLVFEWDPTLEIPRCYAGAPDHRELPLVPMYWFAVGRHFESVRTLSEISGAAESGRSDIGGVRRSSQARQNRDTE